MADIIQVKKQPDPFSGLLKAAPQIAGTVAGGAYGGPAGAAAGGAVGGALGQGLSKNEEQAQVSAVDRRMQSLQSDPLNQLKQGKAALSSMDPDTQAKLSPVLDEAIKKAAMQKQGGAV